jgi:hypothetical protein
MDWDKCPSARDSQAAVSQWADRIEMTDLSLPRLRGRAQYPVSCAGSATALVEMMRTTADPEPVKQQGHSHHDRHATTLGIRPSSRYSGGLLLPPNYCAVTE